MRNHYVGFLWRNTEQKHQGPVVQNIISLMSLLVVKRLTAPVSTVSNSKLFLLKKCSYSHFCSKNISIYAIFNDQSFYNTSLVLNNWTQYFKVEKKVPYLEVWLLNGCLSTVMMAVPTMTFLMTIIT